LGDEKSRCMRVRNQESMADNRTQSETTGYTYAWGQHSEILLLIANACGERELRAAGASRPVHIGRQRKGQKSRFGCGVARKRSWSRAVSWDESDRQSLERRR
jgi:hypothetical protein